MYSFVLLICILGSCAAHMCMTQPPQRGSLPTLYRQADVGAAACYYMHGPPCGPKSRAGHPTLVQMSKTHTIDVVLNKNLDHFNQRNYDHGQKSIFEVNIFEQTDLVKRIASAKVDDDVRPSLSNYTVSVSIPTGARNKTLVVQAIYKSNSHLTFYQCADIKLH